MTLMNLDVLPLSRFHSYIFETEMLFHFSNSSPISAHFSKMGLLKNTTNKLENRENHQNIDIYV